jgi:hypothetical protein
MGEQLPLEQPEKEKSELREDWRAGKAFVCLLLVGSVATFVVSYWRLHFELLHSVEAGVLAIPTVGLLLVPFIWASKLTEYKGYESTYAAILTGLATTPFLLILFVVLYALGAPIWVCFIAPASVGLVLASMYKSAKRRRLGK